MRPIFSILLLSIVLFLFSCKKETKGIDNVNKLSLSSDTVTTLDWEQPTILGEKKENPYNLKNINLALHNLYPNMKDCYFEASHKYYRFLPENPSDYELLVQVAGDNIWDFPIDYSIIRCGHGYRDPNIDSFQTTWQYIVVPASATLPLQIKHEFLYDMFMSDVNSVNLCGEPVLFEDVEEESYKLTGNFDTSMIEGSLKKKASFFPEGNLSVFNKELNIFEPLKGVHVQSFKFGKSDFTHTDNNGHFFINKGYPKDVSIRVKFTNNFCDLRAVKDITSNISFSVMRANLGDFRGQALQNINFQFADDPDHHSFRKMFWAGAQYMNSVIEFREFCNSNNIKPPPLGLCVYLTDDDNISGSSSPMLKHMANSSLLVNLVKLSLIASNPLKGSAIALVTTVAQQYLPDMTILYPFNGENTDRFQQMCYHELGHSNHYRQVGNYFWTNFINYIIYHNGYGDPSKFGYEQIVLSEGWAEYIACLATHNKYKGQITNPYFNLANTWLEDVESRFGQKWHQYPNDVAGFMFDLTDDGEPTSTTKINDAVNQYNLTNIYDELTSTTISPLIFKNNLLINNNNLQQAEVNLMFNDYQF